MIINRNMIPTCLSWFHRGLFTEKSIWIQNNKEHHELDKLIAQKIDFIEKSISQRKKRYLEFVVRSMAFADMSLGALMAISQMSWGRHRWRFRESFTESSVRRAERWRRRSTGSSYGDFRCRFHRGVKKRRSYVENCKEAEELCRNEKLGLVVFWKRLRSWLLSLWLIVTFTKDDLLEKEIYPNIFL